MGWVCHVVRQYRIFCGLRDESDKKTIERIVGEWFEGATIMPSRGLWKGAAEDSNVVEILVGDAHVKQVGLDGAIKADMMIMGLAESLRGKLGQEAVLITSQKIESPEGYGVDSYPWTFEDRIRNWLNDRHSEWFMWCMRNHINTHLKLPWFIRRWLMDITD